LGKGSKATRKVAGYKLLFTQKMPKVGANPMMRQFGL
jgi:hypothetical protein